MDDGFRFQGFFAAAIKDGKNALCAQFSIDLLNTIGLESSHGTPYDP
jgi:hypothetical protein